MPPGTAKAELAILVERALDGDRSALEEVIAAVRDDIYGLAVRMLWTPEDAEDATQEILIRVVTHLESFRGDSGFRTWVYRIASNHLLTTRKRRAETAELTFEEFGRRLANGLGDGPAWQAADAERRILIEEVKVGCSQAMLLCLDRAHRLAYILAEILELNGSEGARVLEITPAAFRKRVSRARQRLNKFMRGHCGLVDPSNACRCHRRVEASIEAGHVDPGRPKFARHPDRTHDQADSILAAVAATEDLQVAASEVQRSNPEYRAPNGLAVAMRELLASPRFAILTTDATESS